VQFERILASELDAAVRNEALWERVSSSQSGSTGHPDLASEALRLYALTSSTVMHSALDSAEPADFAAGLLRSVGDTCAILSRDWASDDETPRQILDLSDVQREIQEFELTDWATSMGIAFPPLPGDSASITPQETVDDDVEGFPDEDLAELWASLVDAHRQLVSLRAQDPELPSEAWSDVQDWACACVAIGQWYLVWARQGSDLGALAVAGSNHLAAQGIFVATHDPDLRNLVPAEALSRLLHEAGGFDWLLRHRAEIPAWVRP
jgi:hypothetical protein